MAGRPQGVRTFVNETEVDQAVKSATGKLYGISLSWNTKSVGDRIIISDSTDGTGTPTKLFEFVLPTTAGSFSPHLPSVGLEAALGIWLNFQAAGGGEINVNVDYD